MSTPQCQAVPPATMVPGSMTHHVTPGVLLTMADDGRSAVRLAPPSLRHYRRLRVV